MKFILLTLLLASCAKDGGALFTADISPGSINGISALMPGKKTKDEQIINEYLQGIEIEHEKKVFSQMAQNDQELEVTISNIEEKTFFIGRRGEREVLDSSPMQRALFPEDLGIAVFLGDQELSYLDFEPDHQNGIRIYCQLGNTQAQRRSLKHSFYTI